MSDAEEIKILGDELDPDVEFSMEACESLTAVPKIFRKMALKTIIKGAKKDGVTLVDKDYAEKFKP